MTSPHLPDDCIYYILKFLQRCHSTLFNCLFVNQFWCKATVPLLYANPFIVTNEKLITTLIHCFNKTEISQLKDQLKIVDIDINEDYKPLFEYLKYLKIYNHIEINHTILKPSYDQNQIHKLNMGFIPMFHQLILYHGINIEGFKIDFNFIGPYFNLDNLIPKFERLNSLIITLQNQNDLTENKFLDNLSIHCVNLKKLKFYSMRPTESFIKEKLCTIIQKQNNLEKFTSQYLFNDIFSSLEFQKRSLVFIEFFSVNFFNISFKNFINLSNLNYLKFFRCKDENPSDRYEILKFATFKLKKLEFSSNTWNENIEPTIIKYLGSSLQSLSLNDKLTISMVENASIYCLNLNTLEIIIIYYNEIDYSLIFPYFKNLRIRKLNVYIISSYHHNMNEMFMNLANNLSISVKEISFIFIFHYNHIQSCFKIFFENCHNNLVKINLNRDLIEPEIILNYIESSNNSLLILSLDREIELNDEKLKLLDEIKANGAITVIDYDAPQLY
ncbi:hypothetical protein RclHR1_08380005 [Rhizophagus clarus]|uniref:F-box domain-containing protein n=1 Tax=Rhizophagus clarus TaxID=94130 RepID=A0A2Z6S0U1_9GLOM|nr:hypothetical protein RclHR1_08380005 [Rhizophagus clarus]GES75671.1 hypothetical protein GLOIN_2v1774869 [Rhizophagus clarus]